ncbi:MAG: DUF4342 domain-containing protein [Clostridia bacterium]|nr:DUF4342 domain-containing protein [Clostridia bacterium]
MNTEKKNGIFSFLYCNRVKVNKGSTPILNLSLLFSILGVLTAPWLVVAGVIVALALGYKFAFERNAAGFSNDFDQVVKGAATNVRTVMDSVTDRVEDVVDDVKDRFDGDNDAQ